MKLRNADKKKKSIPKKNASMLEIGIDFGTVNLVVYVRNQEIVFNEPSVIAYSLVDQSVVAIGTDADEMTGKTHDRIRIVRPLRHGVISDLEAAKDLLREVFKKVGLEGSVSSAKTVLCCPSEVTPVERDALKDLAIDIGSRETVIEEEVLAGVIGSDVDVYRPYGTLVIDIGGGTTDVGVVSLGEVVLSKSIRMAGNFIDREIIKYCKQELKIDVGEKMAEKIKIQLASLNQTDAAKNEIMKIAGRDLVTGIPRVSEISTKQVTGILVPIFEEINNLVVATLKETPAELCSDIYYGEVLLNGGGVQVDYLKEFLEERLKLDIKLTKVPLTSVALGTKILLDTHNDYVHTDKFSVEA